MKNFKEAVSMSNTQSQTMLSDRLLKAAAIAACALTLVACDSKREITGSVSDDYRLRHPITLQQSAKTIDIPVGVHSENLTPSSRSAIAAYARDFSQENAAVIQIMVPAGAENESNAGYMAKQVRTELMRSGVKPGQIDMISYGAVGATDAPVRLAYPRVEAKTLPCGTHPQDLGHQRDNRSHFDFGCTTQANLAVMVANPQDLVQPRGWDARDSMRRGTVNEKYRKGEPTWSQDLGTRTGTSSEVSK